MPTPIDMPILLCESQQTWETWLNEHHSLSPGVWLQLAKVGSGTRSVSYAEALEVALCYGWIDGQKQSFNDKSWLQKFTPRRPKSIWSKINVQKAEALIAQGKMQPAGLKQVEAARQDGRWTAAYDSPANSEVPDDFQTALDNNPEAKAFFATLNKANRYAFCWRIQTAKKPETRQARIAEFITMLTEHSKLHP